MAIVNTVGGIKSNSPTINVNVKSQNNQAPKGELPQQLNKRVSPQPGKLKAPEVDFQKLTEKLKQSFKELENMPSFPRNLLVKLDVGLEFGIFVLPEQLFSKLTDSDTNQTLKIQPPEFLLEHRVLIDRLIAEPAFQKVVAGLLVNESA